MTTATDEVDLSPAPEIAGSLTRQRSDLERAVGALKIVDHAGFAEAGELLVTIKTFRKRIAEVFDPIIESAHHAHKTAIQQRDGLDKPAKDAEAAVKARLGAYEEAQEALRREAEEAARQERERLEAEERVRVEAEQRQLQQEAEEQRLAEAVVLEERGDAAAAERLIVEPVTAPIVIARPVFVPPAVASPPKIAGVSFRDEWSAEVLNLMELVRAVAAGQQPITLLQANQTALNQMAKALKDGFRVPGVRSVKRRNVAGRGAS